jgi:hypothetical protein
VTRRTVTRVLFALAAAGALLALALAAIGGFYVRVAGIRLSARGAIRPLLFALLTASIAMRLLRPDERSRLIERGARIGARLAPWAAAAVAAVVLAITLTYGTRSASGSDSYGYVSQARLWLRGDLHVHQDFVAAMPWPDAEWTFSPLGYRPGENRTIVPTYAPGLPILMAASAKIAGACGPFGVAPACAALVILFAYVVGTRLSGPVTGIAAALIVATSPTFIFMSLWSMSDVPATALWTAALVFAWRARGTAVAALAGLSAGAAIAVRPNLAPLSVFPVALLLAATREARIRRGLAYLGCAAPFVALIAVFNETLYGSALQSGYGDTASLFSVSNIGINVSQFSRWLWESQGPLVFLCVLAPLIRPRGPARCSWPSSSACSRAISPTHRFMPGGFCGSCFPRSRSSSRWRPTPLQLGPAVSASRHAPRRCWSSPWSVWNGASARRSSMECSTWEKASGSTPTSVDSSRANCRLAPC